MNTFSGEELFGQYVKEKVGGGSNQLPEYNYIRDSGQQDGDFVFFRSGVKPSPDSTSTATGKIDPGKNTPGTSDISSSRDPDFILRNFRTMFIETQKARFFDSKQLKA